MGWGGVATESQPPFKNGAGKSKAGWDGCCRKLLVGGVRVVGYGKMSWKIYRD